MTRTARRRWTRELSSEVDGIALGETGPVLLHEYDPPAGGRWVDSAIPGKLAAHDRNSGELLWVSPCEVGYGRGFGAGFGAENDVIVLGPSSNGHRAVRMSLANGELLAVTDMPEFDDALVHSDLCVFSSARRVAALDASTLKERWTYSREGERYHHIGRCGERVFVVFSSDTTKKQGVLCLSAAEGEFLGLLMAPKQSVIHDLAVDERAVVVVASDLEAALPRELLLEYMLKQPDDDPGAGLGASGHLVLFALEPTSSEGDAPLWFEGLEADSSEDLPEVAIGADCGKLYVVKGALLEVRDVLTGRALGDWAVPGLDERVAWQVSQGAGLLAEETRVSIFELPA